MHLSVIVSTYNQPAWLLHALIGFAQQRQVPDFEVVVADDGSGAETRRVIAEFRPPPRMSLVHVWQPDVGFRKCTILNKAIDAARGDYLVFTDGDCIPRNDFLSVHRALREPRRFLSGGYVKLPAEASNAIRGRDIERGRHADAAWLRDRGFRPGKQALKLLRPGAIPRLLDTLSPARASWNGHNASGWKRDLLAVNGFDERMRYGGEDRELGERLENAGVRGKRVRFRAPVVHLHHARPYIEPFAQAENLRIRARTRAQCLTWTDFGIALNR